MEGHTTHIIKSGESLEVIAQNLDISKEELKRFHNTYCSLENLIGKDLSHHKQIIIPAIKTFADTKNASQTKKISKISLKKNIHPDFYSKIYQVKEIHQNFNQPEYTLDYQLNLNYRNADNSDYIFEFEKINHRKNRRKSTDKISHLSIKSFECLMPIPIKLSIKGEFIGILDYQSNIQNKFKSKRQEIQEVFSGTIEKAYLDKMEENLQNEKYVHHQLASSMLFQTLYTDFTKLKSIDSWIENQYLKPGMFPIPTEFKLITEEENEKVIKYSMEGKTIENISLREFIKKKKLDDENPKLFAKLNYSYQFNKRTQNLLLANGTILIYNQENLIEKKQIQITV